MTVRNVLELLDNDVRVTISSNKMYVYIPYEDGDIDRIASVPVGELLRYIPEELLSATVVYLNPALEKYLELKIECPTVNTILNKNGAPFVNCDPKDYDMEKHRWT